MSTGVSHTNGRRTSISTLAQTTRGWRRHLLFFCARKLFQEAQRCIGLELDNLFIHERAFTEVHGHLLYPQGHAGVDLHDRIRCHDEYKKFVLYCNSIKIAMELYHLLKRVPDSACANTFSRKGILIGRLDHANLKLPQPYVEKYMKAYLRWEEGATVVVYTNAKRIMFKGVVNTIGDDVVVNRDDDPQGTPWKAKIREFIYHPSDEEVIVHFVANYYNHVQKWSRSLGRRIDVQDDVTSMNLVETNGFFPFNEDNIKPLQLLQHKFMKIDVANNQAIAYEMCKVVRRDTVSTFFRT